MNVTSWSLMPFGTPRSNILTLYEPAVLPLLVTVQVASVTAPLVRSVLVMLGFVIEGLVMLGFVIEGLVMLGLVMEGL